MILGRHVIVALLLPIALLSGCESTPGAGGAASAPNGSGAALAHARLLEAYNSCSEAGFVGSYAPQFTFATSNTRQPVTTREGLARYLAAGCSIRPNPTVAVLQQSTRLSGAIAVLAGQYRFKVATAPVPGPAAEGGSRAPAAQTVNVVQNFTIVLERNGERWLVLAHHFSVAP